MKGLSMSRIPPDSIWMEEIKVDLRQCQKMVRRDCLVSPKEYLCHGGRRDVHHGPLEHRLPRLMKQMSVFETLTPVFLR